MSGILSGRKIKQCIEEGMIHINPYDPKLINPVSIDLRLGKNVRCYTQHELDAKIDNPTQDLYVGSWGLALQPGQLYLMHTLERVRTDHFVPIIDGKSSIGRLGICVHLTAGFGDPGFDGQYTLEVTAVRPVRVYAGMRFCQMRFHTIEGDVELYKGNYTNQHSMGPVASRSWKQFDE